MTKKLLSRAEFAEAAGFSIRTTDNLIALKQIRTVRVGRRVLISLDELERFSRQSFHPTTPKSGILAQAGGAAWKR